ncbi:helix-turn-helix domain-containing protein [Pelagibius sp. Alg239-R121]|uniref:helix-turn-helix domain-containing protein n=1 Tax=Pelagibius sp. Alg239-R121 TaxID=2993448 RepID=UPI0024A6CD81|nr:helix-turn-helix transcriptional regulator [Pelagibius sp. Alg239-R121]
MSSDVQTSINAYVAENVRRRRLEVNLTQQEVARLLGISFQQLQKYEHGKNRISAGRLYQLAVILETSIDTFFAGYEGDAAQQAGMPADSGRSIEAARLTRQFNAISSASVRRSIHGLIRVLEKTKPA